jgi:ATP-binding cassette subfamily C protein CydD/ATP-binding cassette subfamily C protein CydCD
MRTLRVAFLSSSALELLASISVAIVAVTVGLRLTHGTMTLHAGLLAILLAPEAYWPIRRVGAEFHAAADGATAVDAILAELRPAELRPATSCPAGTGERQRVRPSGARSRVVVEGVAYAYPGSDRRVLDGLSLTAGPGLTVVTGESGAGKSTLLDLVAGLRLPADGHVSSPRVHYVTQRPFLPDGSIAEALRLGATRPLSDGELWAALARVGLSGFVAGLPLGLSTVLGDDGFGLSAGQRTRLALARAALSTARVLLLDEPTAHLDAESSELVLRLVRGIADDRCVVAVTHSDELVAVADAHLHLAGSTVGAVTA